MSVQSKIVRKHVKSYKEVITCACGGEYQFTGITFLTHPEQYEYRCSNCREMLTSTILYPRIVAEEAEYEGDCGREPELPQPEHREHLHPKEWVGQ